MQHILDFYAHPARMTSAGRHAGLFDGLPESVGDLARIVQGLVIHQYVAQDFYGVKILERRLSEGHIRSVDEILDRIIALDPRPLAQARPPERRIVGVCHHHALLLLAMLRAKGIPARYRSGFGAYFNPPWFEEHVVCEYWDADARRWKLADPQFDAVWRERTGITHDILDVPRDHFLIAADAWAQCRAGEADPAKFGIFAGNLRGAWFIAGELIRDLAGLNLMEMLPWDVWGAMPRPDEALGDDRLAFFDRLQALTEAPDGSFADLRAAYENDEGLRVPGTVFNAVLNRPETVCQLISA